MRLAAEAENTVAFYCVQTDILEFDLEVRLGEVEAFAQRLDSLPQLFGFGLEVVERRGQVQSRGVD